MFEINCNANQKAAVAAQRTCQQRWELSLSRSKSEHETLIANEKKLQKSGPAPMPML